MEVAVVKSGPYINFLEYNGKIRLYNKDRNFLRNITGADPAYIRTREQLQSYIQSHIQTLSTQANDLIVKKVLLESFLTG